MRVCKTCGGNADSGCGPTSSGDEHYAKGDCLGVLLKERTLLRDAIDKSNAALAEAVKVKEERGRLKSQVDELRGALYALLHHATKPQPRDEEEQEQVIAKVAKALKSAGKLAEEGASGSEEHKP